MKNRLILFAFGVIFFWLFDLITGELGAILKLGILSMAITWWVIRSKFKKVVFGKKKVAYAVSINIAIFIGLWIITLVFISDGIEYHTIFNDCRVLHYNNGSLREVIHIDEYH